MLCGWEGNRRPGRKQWQPTAGWMTYSHLRADCLYTGSPESAPGPTLGNEYGDWEAFSLVSKSLSWTISEILLLSQCTCLPAEVLQIEIAGRASFSIHV